MNALLTENILALRRSADNIVDLVAMIGKDSNMPCYAAGVATVQASLRQRFQLQLSADDAEQFVETDLIGKSFGSYYTRLSELILFSSYSHVSFGNTDFSLADTIPSSIGHRVFISNGWTMNQLDMIQGTNPQYPSSLCPYKYSHYNQR